VPGGAPLVAITEPVRALGETAGSGRSGSGFALFVGVGASVLILAGAVTALVVARHRGERLWVDGPR
jgi:hypothetical protein